MEPTDKPVKEDPDFIDIPILHPPTRKPSGPVWVRRIVVWSITFGLLIWVFIWVFRIIFPAQPIPANINPETGMDKLPATTGEYVYQEAKDQLNQGRLALRAGKMTDGIAALNELIERQPTSPQAADAYLVLASTYRYQQKDPAKAIETYLDFIGHYPQHTKTPFAAQQIAAIGWELGRQPSPAEAVPTLISKALNTDADHYQNRALLLNLALIYDRPLRDLSKAAQTYKQFIEQFPDDPHLGRAVSGLRKVSAEMKQPDPTPELLQKALEKVGDKPLVVKRIKKLF